MADDRITVELTAEEIGVRMDASDFEERASFAAMGKAGEGSFTLHDIEPIEGGVRVHLRRSAERSPQSEVQWAEETQDEIPVADEEESCDCGAESCGCSDDQAPTSSILEMALDDDHSFEMDAADLAAVIEIMEFTTQALPFLQMPPEARSIAVSLERLRQRLGIAHLMGIGRYPDGSLHWLVMPEFQEACQDWGELARAEYDRINGAPSKVIVAHSGDAGLRVEE